MLTVAPLKLAYDGLIFISVQCIDFHDELPLSKLWQSLSESFREVMAQLFHYSFFQKPWMIWGPVVAVALTAVTAAVLFRT